MRVKVTNKKLITFKDSLQGLKELIQKAEENDIPEDAQVYFRSPRVAEFMWSSLDDSRI